MSGSPVRVAIVDDDDAVLDSAQFLLEVEGHAVSPFPSGAAFLTAQAAQPFDCVILDQHMPDLTGLELAQRLRAVGDRLPIMLISGAMTPDIAAKAAEFGVLEVAEKPVSDEDLMTFVEAARH
jgi:two-component system, LuxR family, response regulator FixJ